MLKIRLQRVGRKNDPSFRLVVTDSRKDSQSGKIVESVGSYNARQGKPIIKLDRVKHWLSVGAQASGTAYNLFIDAGLAKGKKINVLPRKTPIVAPVAETPVAETPAAAPAAPEVEVAPETPAEAPVAEA
jgi:small subunit ribosomal protein S16